MGGLQGGENAAFACSPQPEAKPPKAPPVPGEGTGPLLPHRLHAGPLDSTPPLFLKETGEGSAAPTFPASLPPQRQWVRAMGRW